MPRTIKVLIANDAVSLKALADDRGWHIIYPIQSFDDLGSDYHPALDSKPGALFYQRRGSVALAYKDV